MLNLYEEAQKISKKVGVGLEIRTFYAGEAIFIGMP